MSPDELHRALSAEEEIMPSSGFVANVMDAVRAEATAPPPIPFPWKLAIPGLAAWACIITGLALVVVRQWRDPIPAGSLPPHSSEAGWIALGLLLAYISLLAAKRFSRSVA